MRFPDSGAAVMTPDKAALIHGGEFYQLENTGTGPMIVMFTRSGFRDDVEHINCETRKDLRAEGVADNIGAFSVCEQKSGGHPAAALHFARGRCYWNSGRKAGQRWRRL
jgi:hypothetical protein